MDQMIIITKTSHFFPALIKKIHETKYKKNSIINVWGLGKPKRELIYVDDIADHVFFLKKKLDIVINIGWKREKNYRLCKFFGKK